MLKSDKKQYYSLHFHQFRGKIDELLFWCGEQDHNEKKPDGKAPYRFFCYFCGFNHAGTEKDMALVHFSNPFADMGNQLYPDEKGT